MLSNLNMRFSAAQTLLDEALAAGKGIRYDAGTPGRAYNLIQDINRFRKKERENVGDMSPYDAFVARRLKVKDPETGQMVFGSIIEIEPRYQIDPSRITQLPTDV